MNIRKVIIFIQQIMCNTKTINQINNTISSMLEWTSILTDEIISESEKYSKEEQTMFIKGAAWMLYRLVRNRGQRHVYIKKNMSLDEAIKHCEEVLPIAETAQCAKEHMQLRDWLIELKQYRENKQ